MTNEQKFAQRLAEAVAMVAPESCNGYLHHSHLQAALAMIIKPSGPVDDQYPRMLYRNAENCTVYDASEEAAAREAGWVREAPPQFEAGFPKWMIERPVSRGGWKGWDNRRVMLRTSEDERQFRAVTEQDDWIEDQGGQNIYGARNVGLGELVEDRKELLRKIVDQEVLGEVVGAGAPQAACGAAEPTPPNVEQPVEE